MIVNLFLAAFCALLIGWRLQRYFEHFAEEFNRTLQQYYQDCHADVTAQPLADDYQWLPPLRKRYFRLLPLGLALAALPIGYFQPDFLSLLSLLCWLGLLIAIGVIDFYYRLISTALCQALLLLALFGAWQGIWAVSLAQSVQSLLIALAVSTLFYQLSKRLYRREVFGEGDCWLISALAAFYPWQQLPLLLLCASLLTLLGALCACARAVFSPQALGEQELPFAPALNISAVLLFCHNATLL
ncbi:leader peptidase HopD [Pasteurella testudinis DSM 23072]|uniref:Leader peptidase HopD n=1 Tax=Pasteurella testudinis DSM 23072 TaxID=1122938 RepID=A0A1W1UCQ0_9PAST|nr:prepilin peptidase [Pasteurella testudinis]SMB78866.1 leader peptidase HopD [Pasteurella testudinis DSM 23072]SUB52473.1 type 4 prepilin-like proteins leader peptide-processing enzyme [Pasteurella testudinis]